MLSVVLCSFNGAKYLDEQLLSIAKQTLLPDELIIADDGSSDDTLLIARRFAAQCPFAVKILPNENSSLGATQNFSRALEAASGDYVAFCDQDDVWLPAKLAETAAALKKIERATNGAPCLAHTDLRVVDAKLHTLSASLIKSQRLNPCGKLQNLLAQNSVTGCTVIINRALKTIALPFPREALMHDWWLALTAAATGGIAFAPESLVLYRQHGKNSVGAAKYFSLQSVKKALHFTAMRQKIARQISQAAALQTRLLEHGQKNAALDEFLAHAAKGDIGKIYANGIKKEGRLANILFYAGLLAQKK